MKYKSVLGIIELSPERKTHILFRHPDIAQHFRFVTDVLAKPDVIRISNYDSSTLLFYKHFATIQGGKYIAVVIKTNGRSFILTAYFTSKIKTGEPYEIKS